jgi:hypothetical protein
MIARMDPLGERMLIVFRDKHRQIDPDLPIHKRKIHNLTPPKTAKRG